MLKTMELPDVQQSTDGFKKIPISKVGVRNIKVPFALRKRGDDGIFNTIANISSYCNLVEDVKGINMSRITRTINDVLGSAGNGFHDLTEFVKELQRAHNTDDIYIKANFDYIYDTTTPITDIESKEPVRVIFETTLKGDELRNYITVETTEMSLCPCSKEMSLLITNLSADEKQALMNAGFSDELMFKLNNAGFGAHNQKSIVQVTVETTKHTENGMLFWIEDLVDIIKNSVSSPTWSTLKRPDEKFVTEVSYMGGYFDDHHKFVDMGLGGAMFVEDISRNVADKLNVLLGDSIDDYVVVVNNQESIHSEDIMATAILSAGRRLK